MEHFLLALAAFFAHVAPALHVGPIPRCHPYTCL
jgi:hypothetical protein